MDFLEFYTDLRKSFSCYHAKHFYNKYTKPIALYQTIPNITQFNEFITKLTDNKLYIYCIKQFDQKTIYYDYIIPTAVFLHYMHVDIDRLAKINLVIVNEASYDTYNNNVGGEYTYAEDRKSHLILVRQFTDNNNFNKSSTLCSLFHELTHLVDNMGFIGFNSDLHYYLRWHEIRAKAISYVFTDFYNRLLNSYHHLTNTVRLVQLNLGLIAGDLMYLINNNYYCIDSNLDDRYLFNSNVDNTEALEENIELLTSIREVNVLRNFLTKIEERITK